MIRIYQTWLSWKLLCFLAFCFCGCVESDSLLVLVSSTDICVLVSPAQAPHLPFVLWPLCLSVAWSELAPHPKVGVPTPGTPAQCRGHVLLLKNRAGNLDEWSFVYFEMCVEVFSTHGSWWFMYTAYPIAKRARCRPAESQTCLTSISRSTPKTTRGLMQAWTLMQWFGTLWP